MSTHVHVCQYQDVNKCWHNAIRITSYGDKVKDTIIDLKTHKKVIKPYNIENTEENGCFIYKI